MTKRRDMLSVGILALSGCSALAYSPVSTGGISGPSSWENYGSGPTHRGRYEQGAIPSDPPSVERSERLHGSRATSPVASETFLAVGDERGVRVVPFADDALSHRIEPRGTVAGTPCLDGHMVYVTSDGRFGRADSAYTSAMTADGETAWQTELAGEVATSPTVRGDTVFVRSDAAYLALDAGSGKTRWRNPDAGPVTQDFLALENFGPAAGSDVVVFPDLDGITAVDSADGRILWRRGLQKVRACPVIADGTVYVADVPSGVFAFDLETGDRAWQWSGTGCWAPPAVTDERVYATAGDDVVALERENGELAWRTGQNGLHGDIQSGVSVIGDTVLASSSSLGLVSVRTDDKGLRSRPGTTRWSLGEGGYNTPIAIDDRIVYVEYGQTTAADSGAGPILRVLRSG